MVNSLTKMKAMTSVIFSGNFQLKKSLISTIIFLIENILIFRAKNQDFEPKLKLQNIENFDHFLGEI